MRGRDPFMTEKYLQYEKLKGSEQQQLDFYERMQIDEVMRANESKKVENHTRTLG